MKLVGRTIGGLTIGLLLLGFGPGAMAAELEVESPEPVTSVAELTDVQPTDWAYQAVKTLIERYGLMNGSKTFRGNQPLTRFEFARVISLVMEQVAPIATEDEIKTIRKLQGLYEESLADVRSRITTFETTESRLTNQQFSTTTKFSGISDQILTGGSSNSKISVISRVRLNFDTSFGGRDLLVTQFEAGNGGRILPNVVVQPSIWG